jgi:methyl-accepting chemotaxis protein
MASRELDELGQIVDDAKLTVEELQDDDSQAEDKLDQLHDSLEDAGDAVDALEEKES